MSYFTDKIDACVARAVQSYAKQNSYARMLMSSNQDLSKIGLVTEMNPQTNTAKLVNADGTETVGYPRNTYPQPGDPASTASPSLC